ncbi:hypothetical protein R6242_16215 [Iodobacter sp. CM08]|uniref:hypothetical protein n=1 Tax=Iodobacter sp. CM08 TaxID=3085902 RepID=UPI002981E5FB|nr:hypothetical protein [Iodobacter sp. CM08]MDW5418112.1 hypothetical protein [Iodobacter sp. CM08]
MSTKTNISKLYQPTQVTEAQLQKYEAMSLTDEQVQAILANTSIRLSLKAQREPVQGM